MHGFIYDSTIKNLSEDQFGWGSIVERISDAIKYNSRENHSCYTIGIYGKWGEGKTIIFPKIWAHYLSK